MLDLTEAKRVKSRRRARIFRLDAPPDGRNRRFSLFCLSTNAGSTSLERKDAMYRINQGVRHSQFVIADPSLRDTAGHHYTTSIRLADCIARLGLTGVLATHKDFQLTGSICQILGIYSETIYRPKFSVADLSSSSKLIGRPRLSSLAAETLKLRELISASNDDLIFFHTMTINSTISVLEGLPTAKSELPSHHFVFRYDPNESWMGDTSDLHRVLVRLKAMGLANRIFFYAETDALSEVYQDLLEFPVATMLHFPSYDYMHSVGMRQASRRPQVAYFGEARAEKGFDALPAAIAIAYESWPGGFDFVCQTYATEDNQADISEAVVRLQQDAKSRGYRLLGVLDADTYNALLITSDVIVLPHRIPQYARRGSGIFIDALCSGAKIVSRNGTWMSTYAGTMSTFTFDTDANLAEAICAALSNAQNIGRKASADLTLLRPDSNVQQVVSNHKEKISRKLKVSSMLYEKISRDGQPRTSAPFFSIITVARNDAWSLLKTMRSVFEQTFTDFEYIVVDGASEDNSQELVEFWQHYGLVHSSVSEPDTCVYNAMNKGLLMAGGQFVCFLNASDTFSAVDVLARVHEVLSVRSLDGLLGWGELNEQIWASWTESDAYLMASLGFCHQSLYIRREHLLEEKFDDRPFKTDSDTRQLGRLYAKGSQIAILPEVLAVRGGEPGISADIQRSALSIRNTLTEEYLGISASTAELVIDFRRKCLNHEAILSLLDHPDPRFVLHIACVILDTLFQRQSAKLSPECCERLVDRALEILGADEGGRRDLARLPFVQERRAKLSALCKVAGNDLDRAVSQFAGDEERRIAKVRADVFSLSPQAPSRLIVSLTSFPARLKTVCFAIQSLLEQTCLPDEIHLWLGLDEVPGRNWLPKRLVSLEERGLQIHFAKRTYHQYDKFLHNATLNEQAPFVIVDDDVIYPPKALEHLLASHKQHPDSVIGNRCHKIEIDNDGVMAPYTTWRREVRSLRPSLLLIPTGSGGVLYPPGFLNHQDVVDIKSILAYAPYADDIWLKFCALANSVTTYATELSHKADWYHRYTPTMRAGSLMATNVDRGLNDFQIERCSSWLTRIRPDWRIELAADRVFA